DTLRQDRLKELVGVGNAVAEQVGGEDPLADQRFGGGLRDAVVAVAAQHFAEAQVQVIHIARQALAIETCFEQAESKRRTHDGPEGHADQCNWSHGQAPLAFRLSAPGMVGWSCSSWRRVASSAGVSSWAASRQRMRSRGSMARSSRVDRAS